MVTVTLNEVWIHDADDHADDVRLRWADLTVEPSRHAEVRTYAGGRQRIVTGPARPRSGTVTFPLVDRSSLDKLEDWCGRKVMIRDSRGRVLFGMFPSFQISERRTDHRPIVTLSFREVSGTVEV